jgi:hypothetical protein
MEQDEISLLGLLVLIGVHGLIIGREARAGGVIRPKVFMD